MVKETIVIILGLLGIGGVGASLFIYLGIFNISAITPHLPIEVFVVTQVKKFSVKRRAKSMSIPELKSESLIRQGLTIYEKECALCHGGPGFPGEDFGRGLNPTPPPLVQAVDHWSEKEIKWIIKHGLKMTGMPGFDLYEDENQLNALTAFVVRMNTLSPETYRKMKEWTNNKQVSEGIMWMTPAQGWSKLAKRGNIERGRKLLKMYGCGTCHRIDGVAGAKGDVGPPLIEWKKHQYIAGRLINNPNNMVKWLMSPQEIESHTAMPEMNVSEEDAWHMSRYLFWEED